MTPCPFVQTEARRDAVSIRARGAFVRAHAEHVTRRASLARVPAAALTCGALAYLAWVLAAARGLLSG